jgi:hypothetical protein
MPERLFRETFQVTSSVQGKSAGKALDTTFISRSFYHPKTFFELKNPV